MRSSTSHIWLSLLLLVVPSAWADDSGIVPPAFNNVQEEDASPSCFGSIIKVSNTTLTDNADGTCSVTTGGGGGNSFETIAVPAGASVVADSSTDTLTLTETSFLTLTGTAATDTIDITQVTTDLGTDGLIAANAVALGTDTTNAYVTDLAAGTYIDVSGGGAETATVTVTVDPTEILDVTFAAGANASQVWTWDLSGTDPTLTFGSALVTVGGALTSTGTVTGVAGTFSGLVTANAHVQIGNGATTAGILAIREDTDAGTNEATFTVPALAADTDYTLPADDGDADQVLSTNGTGTLDWVTSSGSDTNADKEYVWPMSALLPLEAADSIPPLAKDAGTNVDMLSVDFDQSTDECRTFTFLAPPDITAGGTVTFTVIWYSASVTTNNVIWDIRHNSGVAEGVDPDQALTTVAAAADAVQGTAGQITVTTWTETQTNLAWAASDSVVGVVCRDANNASDNFAADARAILFGVRIPRS